MALTEVLPTEVTLREITRRPPPRGEEKAAQASGGIGVLRRKWRQSAGAMVRRIDDRWINGSMELTLKRTADHRVRVRLNG
jgi:hypothetical protein